MVYDHDYSPSLYVSRDSLEQSLRRVLLAPVAPTPPQYRSFILEGPPHSGKTWLLHKLQEGIEQEANTIVLPVRLDTFTPQYRKEPDELLLPLVETLKTVAKTKYSGLDTTTISQHYDVNDLPSDLEQIGMQLAQLAANPLVVIIVDGMEEIIEYSRSQQLHDSRLEQEHLLYRLEDRFILPLFRYSNVRLLGSRRSQSSASWRLHPIRNQSASTNFMIAPSPSLQEQYDKLACAIQPDVKHDLPALPSIQSDVSHYAWNNAGSNAMLITFALRHGLPLSRDMIADCLDKLLRSAIRDPFPSNARQQLDTIIKTHYSAAGDPAEQPLPKVCINEYLQINDSQRRDFMNVMAKHGIGIVKGPYFVINSEIITLSQELHAHL